MKLRSLLALFRHVTIKSFEKGEIFIQEGACNRDLYFIRKGLVHVYHTNEKGEKRSFQLYPEYHIFGNFHTFLFDEPSGFTFQALEHTKVYLIDYNVFHDVVKNSKFLNLNQMNIGPSAIKQAFRRIESFVLLSPEERYLNYIKEYPGVINRAPDKYIANVLGITPVSLSRIKGRIAAKRLP